MKRTMNNGDCLPCAIGLTQGLDVMGEDGAWNHEDAEKVHGIRTVLCEASDQLQRDGVLDGVEDQMDPNSSKRQYALERGFERVGHETFRMNLRVVQFDVATDGFTAHDFSKDEFEGEPMEIILFEAGVGTNVGHYQYIEVANSNDTPSILTRNISQCDPRDIDDSVHSVMGFRAINHSASRADADTDMDGMFPLIASKLFEIWIRLIEGKMVAKGCDKMDCGKDYQEMCDRCQAFENKLDAEGDWQRSIVDSYDIAVREVRLLDSLPADFALHKGEVKNGEYACCQGNHRGAAVACCDCASVSHLLCLVDVHGVDLNRALENGRFMCANCKENDEIELSSTDSDSSCSSSSVSASASSVSLDPRSLDVSLDPDTEDNELDSDTQSNMPEEEITEAEHSAFFAEQNDAYELSDADDSDRRLEPAPSKFGAITESATAAEDNPNMMVAEIAAPENIVPKETVTEIAASDNIDGRSASVSNGDPSGKETETDPQKAVGAHGESELSSSVHCEVKATDGSISETAKYPVLPMSHLRPSHSRRKYSAQIYWAARNDADYYKKQTVKMQQEMDQLRAQMEQMKQQLQQMSAKQPNTLKEQEKREQEEQEERAREENNQTKKKSRNKDQQIRRQASDDDKE